MPAIVGNFCLLSVSNHLGADPTVIFDVTDFIAPRSDIQRNPAPFFNNRERYIMSQLEGNIVTPEAAIAVITCLVRRLGGVVEIPQDEFDKSAGSQLQESSDGLSLHLEIKFDAAAQ